MNPGAFWAKVLKGLYFPNCGFLATKRGSRPSWLWSSLLHGYDLLLQCVRRSVGMIPPHEMLVKINCDAAYKDTSAAFGIVVRNSVGSLPNVNGNTCFATSPLHAEVIAIHIACRLAYNHGWVDALVESDSQIAISLSST
nr:reverse transcriptase [Tanacetum cinerariifolium]